MSEPIEVYLRFVREAGAPETDRLMQFAVVTFGGKKLTKEQEQEFVTRITALASCAEVDFGGKGADYCAHVDSVLHGHASEADFFKEVEACLREHYIVKRVTHSPKK